MLAIRGRSAGRRRRPAAVRVGALVVAVVVLTVLAAVGVIVVRGLDDRFERADVIVVPGSTVAPDGTPSPRLRARLDAALVAYREGWAPVILVSGGTGVEGFDEARAMGDYLRRQGVPASAVVEDGAGIDTEATAVHAAQYLRARGEHRAIVATQYFHVVRTELLLDMYGVDVVGRVHARFTAPRDAYSTAREVAALGALYLGGCGTTDPAAPVAGGPGLACRGGGDG